MASPYIRNVRSQAEMDNLLNENSTVVVSFYAAWSAPCRKMAPFYSRLAAKRRALTFVKVEIDPANVQSVGQKCRLIALPTFIMIKNEEEIDRTRGADWKGLADMIVKHAPEAGSNQRHEGPTDGIAAGDESLLEFLDMRKVNCLNEAQHHPLKSIVEMRTRNTGDAYLESDADEQLLITLPFNQEVKVRSVVLHTKDSKFGPKKIKIDINKLAVGFDDMEDATEPTITQVLEVPEEVVKEGKPIHLRFVRLQRVNSLHIFVESNQGNQDITRIDAVDVYGPSCGEPAAATQMFGLRDFWGTHRRGEELLTLFQREGGHQNLFKAIALVRESVLLCPADNEHRPVLVGDLAVALLSQYEHWGDDADLNEAITLLYESLELRPLGHPNRAGCLNNLATALQIRYGRDGNLSDLEEAIEKHREALDLQPSGHPGRAGILNNLTTALQIRYEREGSLLDLEEAIEKQQEVLNFCPVDHPDRAGFLNNVATSLHARYEREGGLSDLEEAIAKHREALNLRPPGHSDHSIPLGNLAIALQARYEREGSVPDLDEAIERLSEALNLHPVGHPARASSLNNLGIALQTRYERNRSLQDLEDTIEKHREALNLRPLGHPNCASSLSNLATALQARYEREGSLSDLNEAIEKHITALNLRPVGHARRASSLNNLATALQTRYQREGSISDLEETIENHREALNFRPPGHSDRAFPLNNLADALRARYHREGSFPDLDEAIEKLRETLDLHPVGHPRHASSLTNLATTLLTRAKHKGNLSDLGESIEKHREALNLRPPGHPDRASSISNLADALQARYECEGGLPDLEEAIEKHREALSVGPVGHPNRASSFNNFATSLCTRYEREGSLSDLQEAIEKQREALDLCPPGHLDHASALSNLSSILLIRYKHEESHPDLKEAIEMQRDVLNFRPIGHPDRARALHNFADALCTRFKLEGSPSDLKEAIEKHQEVLNLCPSGHPNHASSLSSLSNALLTRYEHSKSLSDLEAATQQREKALDLHPHGHPDRSASLFALSRAYRLMIDRRDECYTTLDYRALAANIFTMLREAVNHSNSFPLDRLKAALEWIDTSLSLASGSVADAYNAALNQLEIVLATSNTLEGKHNRLSSKELAWCKQLAVEAASYAVRQGDMVLAVESLEWGRNLLFAQIGRYRVELEELQKEDTELAKRFAYLSHLLDSSVLSDQPNMEGQMTFEDSVGRYRRVASDWNQVLNDIRAVPRFEGFLQPPHYTTLRTAATDGPIVIVIPDSNQSHALIILQDRDTPHYVNLPNASEKKLSSLCIAFIEAARSKDENDADSLMKTVLRKLWAGVVCPIANALENDLHYPLHSRIWWCPSSYFSMLPLHVAGRYGPNADPNQNFPAKYVSSYTTTLQALVRAGSKHNISREENMLIVAQPDTPGQDPLHNALPEAASVAALAEEKLRVKTTLLCTEEGTHSAVLNYMVNHSWVHLTCHGSQNRDDPFNSCFLLHDKALTLREIMQRGLPNAKFAFLAACHTATGDIALLDKALHLAAGLQFAGFRSVVGTMWEVADIDGPVIAEAFYRALRSERVGEGVDCRGAARALSTAVQALRDNGVPISRWIRYIHVGI